MHVVATAGHVDHGKSTLVRALTGMEPDRFAEERARGLTIDLGFAWTHLPSGREVAFVDVPGHVRFIENALAGVGMVDACLFVVAATEGWMPQSEEHLRILELLGLGHGMVALTKAGGVERDVLQARAREVRHRMAGTFLAGAPVVAVDVVAGEATGLGTGGAAAGLAAALDALLAGTPVAEDRGRPRLWVDRCFAVAGAGTVVTGTLTGGSLAVGDELLVVPAAGPAHAVRQVRVRSLQTHRTPVGTSPPGRRVAVNLAGVPRAALGRGRALVRPGQWEPSSVVDARLHVLAGLSHPVERRGAFRLHTGTASVQVAVRILGGSAIEPGGAGLVRLHLPEPLPLVPGDRFVLRESGRSETVGGGEILDVAPVLPAAAARPDRSVARVVRERGWVDADLLERLTGHRRQPDVGRWVVDPGALRDARRDLADAVAAAGPAGLDVAGLDDRSRALLASLPGVVRERGRVRPAGQAATPSLAGHPYLRALAASPFSPPDPRDAGVDPATLRALVDEGLVVRCGDCWFARPAVDRAAAEIAALLRRQPAGVTVSDVRRALGTSRRFALPLLAHLDLAGVTRRRGDLRVGGPALPAPPATGTPEPAGTPSAAGEAPRTGEPTGTAGGAAVTRAHDAPASARAARLGTGEAHR